MEAELDIETILGLAPDATIDVYEAPQDTPGSSALDVFTNAIDNPDVQVISTSWGRCEGASGTTLTDAEATFFQQAAAEGKTIVAAAGDNGSEDCYGQTFGFQRTALAVDDPASQPFVTGVGGTTFVTLGPPAVGRRLEHPDRRRRRRRLIGAGDAELPVRRRRRARRRQPVLRLRQRRSGNCREVPDVAANAGTPFATYCTESGRDGCDAGGWTGFGGTSLSSPIWGAFFALANASPACASKRIGFANPSLYAIAGGAGYASAFTDVTQGNNDLRLPERPLPGRAELRPRHRARDADRGRRHGHGQRARRPALRRRSGRPADDGDRDLARRRAAARRHEGHDPRLGPRARDRRPLRRRARPRRSPSSRPA